MTLAKNSTSAAGPDPVGAFCSVMEDTLGGPAGEINGVGPAVGWAVCSDHPEITGFPLGWSPAFARPCGTYAHIAWAGFGLRGVCCYLFYQHENKNRERATRRFYFIYGFAIFLLLLIQSVVFRPGDGSSRGAPRDLPRLLDEGRIPSTKTGTHRRLRLEDVLAFKEHRDRERESALDDLAQLSQDFGGYEECCRPGETSISPSSDVFQ